VGGLPDDGLEGKGAQPRRVELDARPRHVEDLPELGPVGLGVLADLLPRERLAGVGASRGIADHSGEIADDDDGQVAEILEVA
jgi:hypothetical protein